MKGRTTHARDSGRTPLEKFFVEFARFQAENYKLVLLAVVIITLLLSIGVFNLRLETDIVKLLPQKISGIAVENEAREIFGSTDVVFILAKIDQGCGIENAPTDIRDVRVIRSLVSISNMLAQESNVITVRSIAEPFRHGFVPRNQEMINDILSKSGLDDFINYDYTSTLMMVYIDMGTSEGNIKRSVTKLQNIVDDVEKPSCLKYVVTGTPPMRYVLLNLMLHDMAFTLAIASLVIFMILILMRRSVSETLIIFAPLIVGLTCTAGILGFLNIEVSISTIGLGAMILGLGVEYGVFMVERYVEEREKGKDPFESVRIAVPSVGSSITGSGTTTIAGFLALATVQFPMLRYLGISLALGIMCMILTTIIFVPVLLLVRDDALSGIIGGSRDGRNR